MRISLGKQYKETYEVNYEEKLDQGIYQESKRCKKKCASPRIFTERSTEQKQRRSLDFSLKCVAEMMDNIKIEFARSLENTSDEEVSRLIKEQPKQLNEFEEVIRIVKEILESALFVHRKKEKFNES